MTDIAQNVRKTSIFPAIPSPNAVPMRPFFHKNAPLFHSLHLKTKDCKIFVFFFKNGKKRKKQAYICKKGNEENMVKKNGIATSWRTKFVIINNDKTPTNITLT